MDKNKADYKVSFIVSVIDEKPLYGCVYCGKIDLHRTVDDLLKIHQGVTIYKFKEVE